MVAHFSYDEPRKMTLNSIRNHLIKRGFSIKEYAPEDGFLFTDYKLYEWGTGKRLLSVAVHINDKITITGMGKMDVPVTNLGPPEDLTKIKSMDKLPYSVQKKTFLLLLESFEEIGLERINHWP